MKLHQNHGLTDLYLINEALSRMRVSEPQAEAPRSAKRIALRARRKQARRLGNL
jgi:hypothetical protein